MSHEPPEAFPSIDGDATLGDLQSPSAREVFATPAALDPMPACRCAPAFGYAVICERCRGRVRLPAIVAVDSCSRCPFAIVEVSEDGRHLDVGCGHVAVVVTRERQVATLPLLGEPDTVAPPSWCPLRGRDLLVKIDLGV